MPTICKHCGREIRFDPNFTIHREEGEWVTSIVDDNICEANPPNGEFPTNDPFTHEPAMREYTEAELAEINRKARVAANWGAGKRLRAQRLQAALQWAKLLAALGFTTLAGYFIGAAHRLC